MLDSKNKKIFVVSFIVFCAIILASIFLHALAKSWVEEEEKEGWTECERLCYPSAVDEEIKDKRCICLPEIITKDE